VRADNSLIYTYRYAAEPPLDAPLTAISAEGDPLVERADLEAWRAHTASRFELLVRPGGHFYLESDVSFLAELMHWVVA
jgi:surfactin synthase thioesterase subunit